MRVLLPLFQFGCLFFFLSDAVARTSSTMLNKSDESGHPYVVPDLKGNTCSFCTVSEMLAVGLSYMTFIVFRYVSSISTLLRVFIINGYCFYPMFFSAYINMIMWFLSFIFHLVNHIYWFANVPVFHSQNKFHLSWCMIFFMHCYTHFANILLRILASMFIRDIDL